MAICSKHQNLGDNDFCPACKRDGLQKLNAKLQAENKRLKELKPLIIKHTKAKLKTCECALANNIKDEKLIKIRGECKQILQALTGDKQ